MASTGYVQRSSRWQVLNYLGKYWNTKYRMDRLCRPLVHHIFSSWASWLFSLVHLPSLPPVISIVSHLGYNFKNVRNWRSFCRETKQYSKWNYFTVDISMYVCHVHNVETLLKSFLGTCDRQLWTPFKIIAHLASTLINETNSSLIPKFCRSKTMAHYY